MGAMPLAQRRHLIAGLVGLVTMCALATTFGDDGGPNSLDRWAADTVQKWLGDHRTILEILAEPSTSAVLLPLAIVAAIYFGFERRWAPMALLLIAPIIAVAINSAVLKPLFDRHLAGHLVYPSGHTVSLVAVMTVFALAARTAIVETAVVVIAAVLLFGAAVGMIGLGYHHLTDILGGVGTGIAVVVGVAAVIDRTRLANPEMSRP